jgi:DNA-directed RNA polymerase specialized sigma24 family protein
MASEGSVTHWVTALRSGDQAAAEQLWNRYFIRLVTLCRRRLGDRPRRAADEEDAALNAFNSFCEGARRGRFPQLRDRDDLWQLLVVLASRKAADQVQLERRIKRGGGLVRGESAILGGPGGDDIRGIEELVSPEPTPEFAAMVAEQYERLLGRLEKPSLRTIAQLKLEGYSNEEVAERLDCSLRTVERRLWLIRTIWSEDGFDDA